MNACPRVGGAQFWSYVEYMLNEDFTNKNTYRNVMKGNLFRNNQMIYNLKLKNRDQSVYGGKEEQRNRFYNIVFKDDYIHIEGLSELPSMMTSTPTILKLGVNQIKYNLSDLPIVKNFQFNNDVEYVLFGCMFSVFLGEPINFTKDLPPTRPFTAHAICGYVCDNKYMLYDSNFTQSIEVDWTTKEFWTTWIANYFKKLYNSSLAMNTSGYALYGRKSN